MVSPRVGHSDGGRAEDGDVGSSVGAGFVSAALGLSLVPSSLLHPAPPVCSQPLIPRRGCRDHVRLGGGGESRPPAEAGGAGGRHHWQGQCRPRRQLLSLAAVPRAPSPPSPSRCPLLLLRKEQPAAASSLSRSRCRDSRLAAPLRLRALYGGRGLPAGIRAVPGAQTL